MSQYRSYQTNNNDIMNESGWLLVCSKMQRRQERMNTVSIKNGLIKIMFIFLLLGSCILLFYGRGSIGVIQGFIGILFSIEGYYGALEYNYKSIKRVIIFLFISTIVCLLIGIYSQTTNGNYCDNTYFYNKDQQECELTTKVWLILYFGFGTTYNTIMIVILMRFNCKIRNDTTSNNQNLLD